MRQCLFSPSVQNRIRVMLGVLLLLVLALQSQARAEDSGTFAGYGRSSMEKRSTLLPFRVDVHGVMTWESDLGAGLRLDIPLFDRERVYNARDELAISVGADISFLTFGGSNRLIAWPTVTAMWTLAVSERFSFYPEFGIVACIQRQDWKGLYPNVGFGGRFQLYKSLSLMGRLGWPMAVSIGLTF